jgi:hypothetical protein
MPSQDVPILIGGCFRSGTTLVRRLLNAHSRIHCGPEVKFLRDLHGDYANDDLAHLRFFRTARSLAADDDELLEITGRAFVALHERAAARAGKARWADKNPENVLYLDVWRRLLGERFSFLHVVRSPHATIASMREAGFRRTLPPDLDGLVEVYRRYNEAGLAIAARRPERTLRLHYEALVREPRRALERVMRWLGEEPEPSQLDFQRVAGPPGLEDRKIDRTRGVHQESLARWRTQLAPAEIAAIERGTAGVWARLAAADGGGA